MMVHLTTVFQLGLRDDFRGSSGDKESTLDYSVADNASSRDKRNGSFASVLSGLALCMYIVLLVSCTKHPDNPGDNPGMVAIELVDAFVAADVEGAKAMTVPEQWDRIEKWMEGRQAFKCREGAWDTTGTGGSGYNDTTNNEWRYGLVYQCASQHMPYCLLVDDIWIRETEDGWKVYDWGTICEAYDYGYRCEEMCW